MQRKRSPQSALTLTPTLSQGEREPEAPLAWFALRALIAALLLVAMTPEHVAAQTSKSESGSAPNVIFERIERALESGPGSAPRPPASIEARDHAGDNGHQADITFTLSPDDVEGADPKRVQRYLISKSGERAGVYTEVASVEPDKDAYREGKIEFTVGDLELGEPYYFRVRAVSPEGAESDYVETREPVIPRMEWFDRSRRWLAAILALVCGAVVLFIALARYGIKLRVRRIAGLEAVDEAVGRATEMGRAVLYVPGIVDMNDIQTIAGLTILSRVAQLTAEYDAPLEVPTARSLVMTAAREAVQSAYLAAGRPDAYNEDAIYYVTDEQFGYVAYLAGHMVREKPAACFYLGSFFAESLLLAETGNSIGAIQIAGTAQPAQLPFFVAACDYTLIGEEFFAASAYLSGDPNQLGSLKGQDVGKVVVAALLLLGCLLATGAQLSEAEWWDRAAMYLRDEVLR